MEIACFFISSCSYKPGIKSKITDGLILIFFVQDNVSDQADNHQH